MTHKVYLPLRGPMKFPMSLNGQCAPAVNPQQLNTTIHKPSTITKLMIMSTTNKEIQAWQTIDIRVAQKDNTLIDMSMALEIKSVGTTVNNSVNLET